MSTATRPRSRTPAPSVNAESLRIIRLRLALDVEIFGALAHPEHPLHDTVKAWDRSQWRDVLHKVQLAVAECNQLEREEI